MQTLTIRLSGGLLLVLQATMLQLLRAFLPPISQLPSAGIVFAILTGWAILAAIGFIFLHYTGWTVAMIVQGMCLITTLALHFTQATIVIDLLMLYSVVMVLYLNSLHVRSAFTDEQISTPMEISQSHEPGQ